MASGLLIVYTGGRHKSLPLMGQILRALGRGFRVCVISMGGPKCDYSGLPIPENFRDALEIHNLNICRTSSKEPGHWAGGDLEQAWTFVKQTIDSSKCEMVVLDHFDLLLTGGTVTPQEMTDYLEKCRLNSYVLMATDQPSYPLISAADLVTDVIETFQT